MDKSLWITRLKCLGLSAIFALICNTISTTKAGAPVSLAEGAPGIIMIFGITVVGCFLADLVTKAVGKEILPAIAYISLVAIIMTIPGVPGAEFAYDSMNKIGLLPLCTPILAYAGISLGKDFDTFKSQGVGIVCVALLTFTGTYVGSAVIADIVLKLTGAV